jgi:hypothetical protein
LGKKEKGMKFFLSLLLPRYKKQQRDLGSKIDDGIIVNNAVHQSSSRDNE